MSKPQKSKILKWQNENSKCLAIASAILGRALFPYAPLNRITIGADDSRACLTLSSDGVRHVCVVLADDCQRSGQQDERGHGAHEEDPPTQRPPSLLGPAGEGTAHKDYRSQGKDGRCVQEEIDGRLPIVCLCYCVLLILCCAPPIWGQGNVIGNKTSLEWNPNVSFFARVSCSMLTVIPCE